MKKARTSLFLVVALGLLVLCPVGLADEFADKSVPLFCAVGWLGEFTHIDPSVGEVPPTRNDLPSTLQALAYSPDGILYAGTGNRNGLYKIDPRTGNAEYFLPTNLDVAGMAFSPSGELYVTGASGARYLRTIDLADGSYTTVGTLWGDGNSAQGLSFSPDGTLYAIRPNVFPGTYELLTIDLDDAQMHLLGSYSSTANVNQSITFTADGRLYAIGADAFAQLNPTDGSLIGSHVTLSGDYRGLAIVPPMVYYVDDDATGANDGSSWADAFNYLQDALSAAWSGDEIRVAQGIYKPDQGVGITPSDREATFQLVNGVTLKGGYAGYGESDPNFRDIKLYETILSGDLNGDDGPDFANNAENSYNVVTGSGTDATAILDGFTITGGNANGLYPYNCGGGIFNSSSSSKLIDCIFHANSAKRRGGGMYNEHGSPTLRNCTFSENSAKGGGGIYNWHSIPTLTNCTSSGNSAFCGGGMTNYWSSPTLNNCTIIANLASGPGGGMYNAIKSPTVVACMFSGNSSGSYGGGMCNATSSPILTNCAFTNNSAENGGGVYNGEDKGPAGFEPSDPTLTNCTFTGNSARYGGGMFNTDESSPILTNCILWDDTSNEVTDEFGCVTLITYSNVQGGWPGEGNIDADPCFVEPGYWDANGTPDDTSDDFWVEGDYRLRAGSPCIDAGMDAGVYEDIDGNVRPFDFPGVDNNGELPNFDMGAYEAIATTQGELIILPRTINRTSRRETISAVLRLPESIITDDIDADEPLVLFPGAIEAAGQSVIPQGKPAQSNVRIVAVFDKAELLSGVPDNGEVELTVVGRLNTGEYFYGTDTVRIIGSRD